MRNAQYTCTMYVLYAPKFMITNEILIPFCLESVRASGDLFANFRREDSLHPVFHTWSICSQGLHEFEIMLPSLIAFSLTFVRWVYSSQNVNSLGCFRTLYFTKVGGRQCDFSLTHMIFISSQVLSQHSFNTSHTKHLAIIQYM